LVLGFNASKGQHFRPAHHFGLFVFQRRLKFSVNIVFRLVPPYPVCHSKRALNCKLSIHGLFRDVHFDIFVFQRQLSCSLIILLAAVVTFWVYLLNPVLGFGNWATMRLLAVRHFISLFFLRLLK
jgi:hypothetical protein